MLVVYSKHLLQKQFVCNLLVGCSFSKIYHPTILSIHYRVATLDLFKDSPKDVFK